MRLHAVMPEVESVTETDGLDPNTLYKGRIIEYRAKEGQYVETSFIRMWGGKFRIWDPLYLKPRKGEGVISVDWVYTNILRQRKNPWDELNRRLHVGIVGPNKEGDIIGLAIRMELLRLMEKWGVSEVHTRGHTGVDTTGAREAYKLGLQYSLYGDDIAIPRMKDLAKTVDPHPAPSGVVIDHSDVVIAVWDGKDDGETARCVRYARATGKEVLHLRTQILKALA